MTNQTTEQGLQFIQDRGFNLSPPTKLQSICASDTASAITAGQTTLAGTNVEANLFGTTPSRTGQTSTAEATFGTGEANFAHKVVGLSNSAATTSSPISGFYGGIDSLQSGSITKTSSFSLKHIINQTFVNSGTGDDLFVDQGLQLLIDNLYDISPLNSSKITSMGWDDNGTAYAAGNTSFTGSAAALSRTFDATPIRSGEVVTCLATIPKGSAGTDMNGHTIKRINLNTQTSNVAETAGAITGLVCGVSNQTIMKTVDYSLKFTVTVTSASA